MRDQHPEFGIGRDHFAQLDRGGVAHVTIPSQCHLGTQQYVGPFGFILDLVGDEVYISGSQRSARGAKDRIADRRVIREERGDVVKVRIK
jgi:hypothetical protein